MASGVLPIITFRYVVIFSSILFESDTKLSVQHYENTLLGKNCDQDGCWVLFLNIRFSSSQFNRKSKLLHGDNSFVGDGTVTVFVQDKCLFRPK